ncbi:MAG TPA: hypothetical protein VD932_06335 [Aquabacterium sp.]|nr:hypothetical protein [Aquabacterium sp.]
MPWGPCARLKAAAERAQVAFALDVRGAKKLSLDRVVAFTGEAPLPQADLPLYQRRAPHLVEQRAMPKDRPRAEATLADRRSSGGRAP